MNYFAVFKIKTNPKNLNQTFTKTGRQRAFLKFKSTAYNKAALKYQ